MGHNLYRTKARPENVRNNDKLYDHLNYFEVLKEKVNLFSDAVCEDDPKIDCARLNNLVHVCDDMDHAFNSCRKFCDLCPVGNQQYP